MARIDLDDLLEEQLAFYRAGAVSYESWHTEVFERNSGGRFGEISRRDRTRVLVDLGRHTPHGHVLELAAGTGSYTPALLASATSVTAVDASAESLFLARRKLAAFSSRLTFVEANIFDWRPSRRYDTVFFAYWLSHVPLSRFDAFWRLVGDALSPGGHVFLVDSTGTEGDISYTSTSGSSYSARDNLADQVSRRELDGRTYHVVRIAWRSAELALRLADLGWHAKFVEGEHSLWGSAVREEADA